MKGASILVFSFLFLVISFGICNCYKNPRFSSLENKSQKELSEDLNELNKINEELISNEREGEDDDDDYEEENLESSNFDDIARESLQIAEEKAAVDLENIEMEKLLDEEIFRIIQERLKKLWYIGKCRRDYSNMCPLGWKASSYDKSLCIPPETYEGPCRSMDFSNSTNIDKELFAWKCEVEWACINYPKLNVMDICPSRWIPVGKNLCIAPEDYIGKCSPAMDFTNYDFETRIRWANECNVQWSPIEHPKIMKSKDTTLRSSSVGGPVEESGKILKIISKK
ncbi:Plasmodium falciparum CPW-WPC domain containing protein [Plasmodium gonderi]|uniref:Plasmodium falciparum CPW-WPC domain containing protein n=1 Tax=Plasmodium gonderi TaxID=77519 RepID=A0A1Y1JGT3_PLAGO|nr:Plasmodium falciparum CPW-WPC domain containing protein [Plasmodium gonderi]GAW81731.1 Plasmodium falciparum CPW-WPC domain containing protein [Plasmodium gonderi]